MSICKCQIYELEIRSGLVVPCTSYLEAPLEGVSEIIGGSCMGGIISDCLFLAKLVAFSVTLSASTRKKFHCRIVSVNQLLCQ